MKFKQGQIVTHNLTGEHVLILESLVSNEISGGSYIEGYYVRTKDYKVAKVAEFELEARNV